MLGKEAGHGLLGAAVGIAGEIVECGEEAACKRRGERDVQAGGRLIGISGERDDGFFFLIGAGYGTGFRVALFHANRNDGKRNFHGVGFFVGESFCQKNGFVDGLRADAPVYLCFAFAGDFEGRGLASENFETFKIERDLNGFPSLRGSCERSRKQ